MSSLFYASPRLLKEESSEHSSLDDNTLNLQYVKHVKETNENFETISKYVKLKTYSKHMKLVTT